MLKKLIKHEWLATWKNPVSYTHLLAVTFTAILFYFQFRKSLRAMENPKTS